MSDIIERRVLWAEGQLLRDRPPERKIKWLKTHCTHCGALVEYAPREYFRGALHCGHCGKPFHMSRLDDFMGEEVVK